MGKGFITASSDNRQESGIVRGAVKRDRGTGTQLENLNARSQDEGAVAEIRGSGDGKGIVEITANEGVGKLILISKGEGDRSGGIRTIDEIAVRGVGRLAEALTGTGGNDGRDPRVVKVGSGDKRGGGGKLYG